MTASIKTVDRSSGFHSVQGPRPTMEDKHVLIDDVSKIYKGVYGSYYAVFDGHGGIFTARQCESSLLNTLMKHVYKQEETHTVVNMPLALTSAFEELDQKIMTHKEYPEWKKDGSTAAVVFMVNNALWAANVGDTEILLGKNTDNDNYQNRYKILSLKHKPDDPSEEERIKDAQGYVAFGRVCGMLAVSRAFGDAFLKQPIKTKDMVSVTPYITSYEIEPDDGFLIIGCDGLWDVLTYEKAYEHVVGMRQTHNPQEIAQSLVNLALELKTRDNVTVIIVFL